MCPPLLPIVSAKLNFQIKKFLDNSIEKNLFSQVTQAHYLQAFLRMSNCPAPTGCQKYFGDKLVPKANEVPAATLKAIQR